MIPELNVPITRYADKFTVGVADPRIKSVRHFMSSDWKEVGALVTIDDPEREGWILEYEATTGGTKFVREIAPIPEPEPSPLYAFGLRVR